MYGEKGVERHLQSFLKELQRFNDEEEQWMSSDNSKSKRDFQRKLQELKQGSMTVDEYFQELELAMIRAKVKESSEATKDRFVNGLNLELASFAKTLSFLDIDLLVQFVAEHEQNIKQQRCSKRSSSAKEIESFIVTVPNDEQVLTKKEDEELKVENQAEKCEEDLLIPSTNTVDEEVSLNHEKKGATMSESNFSENVLERKIQFGREKYIESIEYCQNKESENKSDFSETILERKIQFEREKDIESIECCQNKESKNESEELSEKKDEKSCEKSEVKSDCKDIVLATNDLNHYLPCNCVVLQEFLDLIPKKPPDGFLSSRSIKPSFSSSGIEKHSGSLEFDILDNLLPCDFDVLQVFLDLIPKKPPDGFISSRSIGIEKHFGSLKFDILDNFLPCDFDVFQVFLDLIPKKPPDGFLSSRIIEPSFPSSGIEKHSGSIKFDIVDNLLPLRCLELNTLNFHCPMDFAVYRCSYMHVAACFDDTLIISKKHDEHVNDLLCMLEVLRKEQLFSILENSDCCMENIDFPCYVNDEHVNDLLCVLEVLRKEQLFSILENPDCCMENIDFLYYLCLLGQGKLNKRHTCCLKFIETFPYVVKYKKGNKNLVVDALFIRYKPVSLLNTRLLGFEYFKKLYASDIGFAEMFLPCEIEHHESIANKQRGCVLFEPEDAYKIDLPCEYSVIVTFNVADSCPFDPGGDSRTNPIEERGNDATQNEQIISSNSNEDSRTNPFEERGNDVIQNQQVVSTNSSDNSSTSNDHFQILARQIMRAQAKIFKEALNWLIQELVANQMAIGSTRI